MLRSGALAWSCTGPCDKILWSSCWNPPQEVIALRPCKRSAPVLVWKFFWDAHREFLYKDLLRSSISKVLVWANAANNDAFFCFFLHSWGWGGVGWCGVVWGGGVGWGGVVWGGVGWCGVVWCGVGFWGGVGGALTFFIKLVIDLHSKLTLRYKILSCTCTATWQDPLLHLHVLLTLRYIFFALAQQLDATLQDLLSKRPWPPRQKKAMSTKPFGTGRTVGSGASMLPRIGGLHCHKRWNTWKKLLASTDRIERRSELAWS